MAWINVEDRRFPHTRGGVPSLHEVTAHPLAVFPTHVGVYLRVRSPISRRLSFPHTRGGVPLSAILTSLSIEFSPHTWGCTLSFVGGELSVDGFPHTRGGVPRSVPVSRRTIRFPHTRGGVPRSRASLMPRSPVFPTHVGVYLTQEQIEAVVRSFSPHTWGCIGTHQVLSSGGVRFPHTRGGVPRLCSALSNIFLFSPHTWGCTFSNP